MVLELVSEEAQELNKVIETENKAVFDLLSEKGKGIFFPKLGILSQAKDAKPKTFNAAIGLAMEDDMTIMNLGSIREKINLPSKDVFPYVSSSGKQELREKWLELMKSKNPSLGECSLPIVTSGLSHGLTTSAFLFLDEGDSLITTDFYWENYRAMFENWFKAKIDTFKTFEEGKFNVKGLKEKLSEPGEKKVVLLNFPNNPAGYTPTNSEVEEIVKVIEKASEGKKIVVIIDDAYFGLVYEDGVFKESIFSLLSNISENVLAVKIDGPTKEDYVWGLRIGFITFGIKNSSKELLQALEDKTAGTIRGSISMASHLSQSLLLSAYSSPNYENEKKEKYEILKARYLETKKVLENPKFEKHFKVVPFNSGYFMCIQLNSLDAEKVRLELLENHDTGVVSLGDKIRVAFSSMNKTQIKPLFENIYNACEVLEKESNLQ